MDPLWLAQSKLRRRKFEECITLCDEILAANPLDKAAWFTKTRAITEKDYIDDTEMEEETLADVIVNEESLATAPRPGTSLYRPNTTTNSRIGTQQSFRPMTGKNRPMTGFARPSTSSRGRSNDLASAFKGNRPGTQSRPLTMSGRLVRLGTQSMLSGSDKFINPDTINIRKYAQKQSLAKILIDFLLYSEHNPRKALELASEATRVAQFEDWFWKLRLGQCYYQLGMYRDAEKQLKSSLKHRPMIETYLHLVKVYLKMDQPKTALKLYETAALRYGNEKYLMLGQARIEEALNNFESCIGIYREVLRLEPSCVEAMASLGAQYFYNQQPELALRYYRRLLQMGVQNAELWNNMGLCCFYAGQYDICLPCFEQALSLASDENTADIWFNISHIAITIGDLNLAYQTLKIAVSADGNHAEAWNNLGVLEMRNSKTEQCTAHFKTSADLADYLYEPLYNGALSAFSEGDCQSSLQLVLKSLQIFEDHDGSKMLQERLQNTFNLL